MASANKNFGSPGRWAAMVGMLTSPVIGGAVLGYYLDDYFKTAPILIAICIFIGIFTGFYNFIKMVNSFRRETGNQ
jgi:F0F1-type ATP synthase assembly protein I